MLFPRPSLSPAVQKIPRQSNHSDFQGFRDTYCELVQCVVPDPSAAIPRSLQIYCNLIFQEKQSPADHPMMNSPPLAEQKQLLFDRNLGRPCLSKRRSFPENQIVPQATRIPPEIWGSSQSLKGVTFLFYEQVSLNPCIIRVPFCCWSLIPFPVLPYF